MEQHLNTTPRERKSIALSFKSGDTVVEAMSKTEDVDKKKNVVFAGSDGFIMAVITAFAQHLPLELSPDHVWMTISYAFARHVDQNGEELRKNFVQHGSGQLLLKIETPNNFFMSNGKDPDTGASTEDWERYVFPGFSEQIKKHIGEYTHSAIVGSGFSTTTPAAQAATEISLMSAMKKYFRYGMMTKCGIPQITLLGTLEDWESVRRRAEQLGSLMTPKFSQSWMPALLPVLDEFVDSFKGNVNHTFWQSIVKLRQGTVSGSKPFISGWVQLLFPYRNYSAPVPLEKLFKEYNGESKIDPATGLPPWQQTYFGGPELHQIPRLDCSAPVEWDYIGKMVNLEFHAGVLGFTQSNDNGALSPLLGWYVSRQKTESDSDSECDAKYTIDSTLEEEDEFVTVAPPRPCNPVRKLGRFSPLIRSQVN